MDPMHAKLAADLRGRTDPETLYTRADMAFWVWLRRVAGPVRRKRAASPVRQQVRHDRIRKPA